MFPVIISKETKLMIKLMTNYSQDHAVMSSHNHYDIHAVCLWFIRVDKHGVDTSFMIHEDDTIYMDTPNGWYEFAVD